MSEQINYEEFLPHQPADGALEWCIRTKFTKEYLIYRSAWRTDPLTGFKEDCVRVTCTACGGSWLAEKVRDESCCQCGTPFGFFDEKAKKVCGEMSHMLCPECGAAVEVKHVGRMPRYGIDDNVFFCEPWQLGNKFCLLGWRCERNKGVPAEQKNDALQVRDRYSGGVEMAEDTKRCTLPKSARCCQMEYAGEEACAHCGWQPEERARRKALPLTEDENGVRRKHVGAINEANSREN